ncbi:hypothetical protein vBCbaSRXM_112 [Citromicrobium phage vB_CbaS-RXM]|nr:hypothetical protein vBCbaSRXM_112 [Citromicrobium phage vB_CbaS-RXM]
MTDIPLIGQKPIPDLNYLQKLPVARSGSDTAGQPGKSMFITSGWVGRAVANRSQFPENPDSNNYVIGVNGRGSLQIAENEFDELLSSMLAVARVRAGFEPTEK